MMKVQNYQNAQPRQFLVLLLEMIQKKNARAFQFKPQIGLYEESRGLVVIGKAQRLMHKDSSGALQYTPDSQIVYFHVNESCIRRIFSYLMDFLYRFGFEFLER